jgi:hypothetical protein
MIFLFVLFNCVFTSCVHNNTYEKIDSIKITYVNKGITTPFGVDCSIFENAFGKSYKYISITDSLTIEQVKKCLESNTSSGLKNNIDVRGKMDLFRNNQVIGSYCFDGYGQFQVDNKDFFRNKCLFDFINQQIAEKK